jgi:hypothetical protein
MIKKYFLALLISTAVSGCSIESGPFEPYPIPELYIGPYGLNPWIYPNPYWYPNTIFYYSPPYFNRREKHKNSEGSKVAAPVRKFPSDTASFRK